MYENVYFSLFSYILNDARVEKTKIVVITLTYLVIGEAQLLIFCITDWMLEIGFLYLC